MKSDLTQGKIFSTLLRLALPIAGGQVMQMAYNLTDMFWLGRVSGEALAATGAAGLFTWLAVGLMMIGRVGAEVGVSQARGRGELNVAYSFSRVAIFLAGGLGLLFGAFLFIFRNGLIGFFNFQEVAVAADAATYTGIMAWGLPAMYITSAVAGAFIASGNSQTPFLINSAGLVLNMILTPIVIFPLGMGVSGAAISSVASQWVVLALSLVSIKKFRHRPFAEYRFFEGLRKLANGGGYDTVGCRRGFFVSIFGNAIELCRKSWRSLWHGTAKKIFHLALPVSLENTVWPLLTILVTRIEVSFGDVAVAISRVGIQVESLSWLVGAGFGAALTAFVGQNFGAGRHDRISKGVRYTAFSLVAWGIFVMAFMWFGGGLVFAIFMPHYDYEVRELFITHMRILAACQVFSNMEYVASNAFRGKGRTIPPSITSMFSNTIRLPLALILSQTQLGLLGVWAAISITAGLRGVLITAWYLLLKQSPRKHTCVKGL